MEKRVVEVNGIPGVSEIHGVYMDASVFDEGRRLREITDSETW
jgi:hypothetical protein